MNRWWINVIRYSGNISYEEVKYLQSSIHCNSEMTCVVWLFKICKVIHHSHCFESHEIRKPIASDTPDIPKIFCSLQNGNYDTTKASEVFMSPSPSIINKTYSSPHLQLHSLVRKFAWRVGLLFIMFNLIRQWREMEENMFSHLDIWNTFFKYNGSRVSDIHKNVLILAPVFTRPINICGKHGAISQRSHQFIIHRLWQYFFYSSLK